MSRFLCFVFAVCMPLTLSAVTAPQHKKAPKTVARTVKGKPKPTSKSRALTHGKVSSHGVKAKRGKTGAHAAPVQRSQAAPTSDRYREIQQALVAKGYLKSEPTGVWDADTQAAMRRFQTDQKLDETGKINSLSLISLGLGPQH